jgi:large subunit ribosomal protein L29
LAIYRIKQIREMASSEREKKMEELYTELSQLRVNVASGGAVENPGRIKLIRRTISKFLTVIREEQIKTEKKSK